MEYSDLTKKLIEYLDGTKDFILENAPSFFHEVVIYGRAVYSLASISIFLIVVCCPIIVWKCLKKIKFSRVHEMLEDGSTKYLVICLAIVPILIASVINLPWLTDLCLMSWFAPKLFLFKYLLK